jgi:hypothetical protein
MDARCKMNWAGDTQGRFMKVYKGIIDEHYKSVSDDITFRELLVRAEILKRDFTKRQKNIIWMIFTFSFPYGKYHAVIPKLKDFELCGVSKTKIKEELNRLVELNVLSWDEGLNKFEIKSPVEWEAPYHYGYNDPRSVELFILNLKDSGVDITPILEGLKEM